MAFIKKLFFSFFNSCVNLGIFYKINLHISNNPKSTYITDTNMYFIKEKGLRLTYFLVDD